MSSTDPAARSAGSGGLTLGETLGLVVFAGPLIAGLTVTATALGDRLLTWLLEHGVLVHAPLLSIPGLDGAGLDLARLLIVVGLVGLALTVAISAVHRRSDKPSLPR